MAKKRKASPNAFPHHRERRSKRRETPSDSAGSTVSEHLNPSPVENGATEQYGEVGRPEQSAESLDEPPCPMEFLTAPCNAEKSIKIFDHLIAYYQRQVGSATRAGTSHIFRDLRTIKLCISKLLSDNVELKITLENLIVKDKVQGYQTWRSRYEAMWASPAIAALQKRFMDLITMDGQPLGRAELMYFEFAKDLETLAMGKDFPGSALQEDWDYLAPRFVSLASAIKAAKDFEQEYLAFQDRAYAGSELTSLWLLVWRTLKAVKLPLPVEPEEAVLPGQASRISERDRFAIERLFFGSDGNPTPYCTSLRNFLQRGDVNNPKWIESYVAKYCNHVAKCHEEMEKYYWQFRTMDSKPVAAGVTSTLKTSNQQPVAHSEWNMLLHRIVLRLNYLLGDRKVLKRWWRDKETQVLAYLDVNQSSTGVLERGQVQPTTGAPKTNDGINKTDNGVDASDEPPDDLRLGSTQGGAAGNGGQDGEGSGGSNNGDRKNEGRNSSSSISAEGSSSNDDDQENQPPDAESLPTATQTDIGAFARRSAAPANDEAATAEVHTILDEFSSSVPDTIPSNPRAMSASPLEPFDQENVTPSTPLDSWDQESVLPTVDAGSLATRVLPSAFSYVNYPLGETRASERAMSMQIAREMRQPGITSSGPHVEDVQNIAPQPLRLVPNPDDVFVSSRSPGVLRRSIGMLQRLLRPPPSIVPERLPSLPPRRSPRKPTPSPLTANRYGTSGVQKTRDRASRFTGLRERHSIRPGGSRASNPSFTPQRSWLPNLPDNMPWDSPTQPPRPPPNTLQDMPRIGVEERRPWSVTPPEDTTAEPPSQSSGIFMDRNTIRRPVTPTPENRRGRARNTNLGITARTVHGSPEEGASPPSRIEHPGDGSLVEAGPDGDPENAVPPWEWIPEDNPHYMAFLADDRDRIRRGDTGRLAAHRAIDALEENQAGHAIMMDLYQLLRARYEWGLTHDYRFPQHVPGYYRPPAPLGTPRTYRPYRGGAGSAPGYLNVNRPEAPAGEAGSSPRFQDRLPNPNLWNRAARPPSWGIWNGGENAGGNPDFDLYASPGDGYDQPVPDRQESEHSFEARRELLLRPHARNRPSDSIRVSTLNLPSPAHPEERTGGQRLFTGQRNASRQGSSYRSRQGGPFPARPIRRRTSGGSSLGKRASVMPWTRGSNSGSWPTSRLRSRNSDGEGALSPGPSNPGHRGAQIATSSRMTFSDVHTRNTQTTAARPTRYNNTDSRTAGSLDAGSHASGDQNAGNLALATPTHMQYMQMTMQQLRDEITHRGGEPRSLRQRKEDFVQALLDYDAVRNYGNGARDRRRAAAIAPHPTLSPRALRPRNNGKVVRRRRR
jgi:hypothetical protein